MANVPGMHRRRAAGDPVTGDEQIRTYMRRVRSSLRVSRGQRSRVVEEIENHLDEGAADHMRDGATRAQAVALAIEDLGPPEAVASAFSTEGPPAPPSSGLLRWLPLLLPIALLAATVVMIVWSTTLYPGRSTRGERTLQLEYLRAGALFALLAAGAWRCIQRADRDRAWRWAAWACAGGALAYLAIW